MNDEFLMNDQTSKALSATGNLPPIWFGETWKTGITAKSNHFFKGTILYIITSADIKCKEELQYIQKI